ncbi:MAG: GEVED domain-containing protein [Crocinitomicaceae bacterium]|nr:GEVED domain-containing protein [Crocinitomicaceae bacterium]
MKAILMILMVLFVWNNTSAQDWKEMMYDPNVNVYDVIEAAEAYFENVDIDAKGSGWKGYQRWKYETEPKFYPSGDRSTADPYFAENAFKRFNSDNGQKALFNSGWEELGPHYIEQVTGHYAVGLGRVESFFADPNDVNRIYIGSRSGGFWKTIDGGVNWTESTTDFLIASGVNTMTVSPTNSDSVLINVRNARNGTTHGIYRSVDAGDNWVESNFNPTTLGWGGLGTNRQIYQIAYHPTISGLVFIGSNEGLFRSDDDLATWTTPVPTLDFRAFAFHPTNPNIIYATTSNNNNAIYVSTDAGITFNATNALAGNSSSIKLSTSAACPNCVYVGTSDGIWKSIDEGQNFTLLSNPGIDNYGAFAVSDVNTDYMLFGDIDTHMSTDEGQTFNQATFWSQGNANYNTTGTYVHADIRGARCQNGVFWVNTDGLLCKSLDNGVTWEIYEGQSIRENYNLGLSQSNHARTICGSQDNGTSIKTENSWVEFYGADGMEGIIHPLNDDWMIGSLQYGGRRRTKDGGMTQSGVTPPNQSGGWVAPLVYDPNDQMVVYSFGENIHRSDNFGSSWTQLGTPSFSGTISHAAIAQNDSDELIVSKGADIEKSLDGGVTFIDISSGLPNSSITDIAIDPNDDHVIVVTYGSYQNNGQKVYITNNQGLTWSNITHNLNDLPVRSVVIDHTDASTIYLGTEIGIYKKAMVDNSWSLYNPDLPNTSILEMEVMNGSNTLRAATWGRGLWEFTLDGRQSYPSITKTSITDMPDGQYPMENTNPQYVYSTVLYDNTLSSVYLEWSANTPTFGNVINMVNTSGNEWESVSALPFYPAGTKMYFKVFAVGNAGDTTETYKFMYEVEPFGQCESFGNMSYTTAVTLVDFNGINNLTGKLQPYTDYTMTDSAEVVIGGSYNLNVNLDTDGNYVIYSKAWIDWNQNGDFTDIGEEYDMGTAQNTANGPTNLSPLVINVPAGAVVGKTTMRVSAKYNASPTPCETGFDGEVEDYRVIVNDDCIPSESNTTLEVCNGIEWNGTIYSSSGSYSVILVNAAGCDSTAFLDLTVNNVNTVVTQNENILTAASGLLNYQWIDCDDNNSIILGATNETFIANANGEYAVVVDSQLCVDTSECFIVDMVGIDENQHENAILISPNPSSGKFSIEFNSGVNQVDVLIYSEDGKMILSETYVDEAKAEFDLKVSMGVYFVVVQTSDNSSVHRLVIK